MINIKHGDLAVIVKAYGEKAKYNGRTGVYQDYRNVTTTEGETFETPAIEMPDGIIVYGFECWWISKVEHEKAMSEAMDKVPRDC